MVLYGQSPRTPGDAGLLSSMKARDPDADQLAPPALALRRPHFLATFPSLATMTLRLSPFFPSPLICTIHDGEDYG